MDNQTHSLNRTLVDLIKRHSNRQAIIDVINQGAKINHEDSFGFSPIMHAAECQDLAQIQLLLKLGADIQHEDLNLNTALHLAYKNPPIIKFLIEQGLKVNQQNIYGETILMKSVCRNYRRFDLECFQFLMENQADINLIDSEGFTTLSGFVSVNSKPSNKMIDIVKIMLDAGADPDIPNLENETALTFAKLNGLLNIAHLLESTQEQKQLNTLIHTKNHESELLSF